jgi:hypothetical protein
MLIAYKEKGTTEDIQEQVATAEIEKTEKKD